MLININFSKGRNVYKNAVALFSPFKLFSPSNCKAESSIYTMAKSATLPETMCANIGWMFLVGVMFNVEFAVGQTLLQALNKNHKTIQYELDHYSGAVLTIFS
jgi:hypothetical protein